ncbi:uncharacterized protein LOC117176529 [Belonocnema kinseyi]|uniref:uncharacterized protein LOC117176529 n=1 Tax=Belonocnema kinseyi TaxID=2817044 RepID=UPI00143D1EAD|nr:uncharacterized protein LOC117176529 [Belonocnema kinseyi]
MKTVVSILFLTFVALLDSGESTFGIRQVSLNEVFRYLEETANKNVGSKTGIYYFKAKGGTKVNILTHGLGINIEPLKVIEQGFVIGLKLNNQLARIYDQNRKPIVIA